MAFEREWTYAGTVSGGEADGRKCIFCEKRIVDEAHPAHWHLKAVEDNPDADFIVEDGYAHFACSEAHRAHARRGRFTLPDIPGA